MPVDEPIHGSVLREAGSGFQSVQRQFAARIRAPGTLLPDAGHLISGIEPRRMKIYQDLFFNNIESFIAGGFPVLRSLYAGDDWRTLVRQFMQHHSCRSPYFVDIGREFLDFLERGHVAGAADPVFLRELAHYEWVELALDVAIDEVPDDADSGMAVLDAGLVVSPVAWPLVYQYPVHKINAQYRPDAPSGEPICLLVYRNRADIVKFVEINPITVHLLQILDQSPGRRGREVLEQIASEIGRGGDPEFIAHGGSLLESFRQLGVVATI